MRDMRVPVEDGSINVWHRPPGDGRPTVVLVHGLTGNSRWFTFVIEHLPRTFGVIALDVRGRGGSWDAPPPFDLATIADDIARCLGHLDLERVSIAGYSMGGWVTGVFAKRHPDRVNRMILIDGGLPMALDPSLSPDDAIRAVVGPALARLELEFDHESDYTNLWKSHPGLGPYWEDRMGAALAYELHLDSGHLRVRANDEAIALNGAEITTDPDSNWAAAETPVPTHLIVVGRGTADQPGGMISRDTAEAAAEANPNIDVEYLENLNHYTLLLGTGAPAVAAAIGSG